MTNDLHCAACDEAIRVEKQTRIGLLMTCGCPDRTFSIKTAMALPGEWSA